MFPRKRPPRPHPLARAPLAEKVNETLGRAWQKGWLDTVPIDAESLWERARSAEPKGDETGGRTEADILDFRERLERLSTSLQEEAELNSLGRAMAYGQLLRALRQRLRLGKLWREQPAGAAARIAPPIIVVGQMRAGTTRLHRLLAADPAHAATRFCDSWNPVPTSPDFRPIQGAMQLYVARQLDPWIDALHPMGAKREDEELGWLAAALDHCAYEAQWRIPSFVAFSEEADAAPIYREFARILASDAAHRANADKPRVLKVPQFAEDLGILLAQFPDARVVLAERCPEEVARSAASLVANQMAIQSDSTDLDWIEAETRRKIALRKQRMESALASFEGPVAKVDFRALDADWRGEIGQIYRDLGVALSGTALAAMQREQGRSEKGSHKEHREQLKRFAGA